MEKIELNANFPVSGMASFNTYLSTHTLEAESSKVSNLYFHVNVVAESYSQGFKDGQISGNKEFYNRFVEKTKEKFFEKANQVYLSAKSLIDSFLKKDYKVEKIYINVFHKSPKVIVVISEELLLDDSFVEYAYTKIHEKQCSFHSLFENTLDLSLVSSTDLNEELLKLDGFQYSE